MAALLITILNLVQGIGTLIFFQPSTVNMLAAMLNLLVAAAVMAAYTYTLEDE